MKQHDDRSDFVIIGGVAAGPKTAATLVRRIPDAKVTLFQKEQYLSYSACGLPYIASGDLNSFRELMTTPYGVVRDSRFFEGAKGFKAVTQAQVIKIDRDKKLVSVRMLNSGQNFRHGYGKLILTTGAAANKPSFPVAQNPKIRPFKSPDDAIYFRKMAQAGKVGRALIVGGGFIGCELAEAVSGLWGIEVTLIEKEAQLLPNILDDEMSALVFRELAANGIKMHIGCEIENISQDDKGNPVACINGEDPITADYVFLCLGVHPEVSLARDCQLAIGETGGILVDKYLRTSDPDIYAGGDCVEQTHQISGKKILLSMGSIANRQGRIIAENLAGNMTEFPGVLRTMCLRIFDINVGSVGLGQKEAESAGFKARAVWGTFPDKPDFHPEKMTFVLKMIYSSGSNQLLGLQGVGQGDVSRCIDVFASFLQRKATIDDLFDFEHGYAPACSDAIDPLYQLSGIAKAQQKGICFINPRIDLARFDDNVMLLDVREKQESGEKPLPSAFADSPVKTINVPIDKLSSYLDKLNRHEKTIMVCQRGSRSYQAALLLKSAGFKDVSVLGGGLSALTWST